MPCHGVLLTQYRDRIVDLTFRDGHLTAQTLSASQFSHALDFREQIRNRVLYITDLPIQIHDSPPSCFSQKLRLKGRELKVLLSLRPGAVPAAS